MIRQHKHLIIRALVNDPLRTKKEVHNWILETVSSIDMNIMAGPLLAYAEEEINRGWTGVAIIEFSHISLHIWENEGLVEFDVFSCKDFSLNAVIEQIKKFGVKGLSIQYIDRDSNFGQPIKFYVVYKTTNKINGNYYIGVHGSDYIDLSYLGSGKLIRKAIEKHGKENFSLELVKFFLSEKEAYVYESELVNEETIKDKKCYNLVKGGKRGRHRTKGYISDCVWITDGKNNKLLKRTDAIEKYIGFGWEYGRFVTEETKKKLSKTRKGKTSWKKGKKGIVSKETKEKTSKTLKARYQKHSHHSKGKISKRDKNGRFIK